MQCVFTSCAFDTAEIISIHCGHLAGCTGEDEQDMAAVEILKRKVCYFPRLGRGNWGVEPTAGGGSSRAATRNRITATAPAKKAMSRPILLVNGHVK